MFKATATFQHPARAASSRCGGQRAESREQRSENREQRTEIRDQRTEDTGHEARGGPGRLGWHEPCVCASALAPGAITEKDKRPMQNHIFRSTVAAYVVLAGAVFSSVRARAEPLVEGAVIWDVSRISDRADCRVELTDLVRFNGNWYCAFREGEIHHNHPSGRGRVIRSSDGENWESVALFEWDRADVREIRFSITPEGWLMVNTSVFFCSAEPRQNGAYYQLDRRGTLETDSESEVARQSVTWLSPDGVNWSSAYACPTGVNTWRWDVT